MSGVLLVTCFEPFGGRRVNMSREAVLALPERIGGWTVRRRCLPVAFGLAAEEAAAAAEETGAEAVLCVGEAGSRKAVTPELVALNLRHARIPDNRGLQPKDEPAVPGGENALFSTLPARRMAEGIAAAGIPAEVSYSAGVYVCNDLFYGLLHRFRASGPPCGFIHVPAEGFSAAELAAALAAAVGAV